MLGHRQDAPGADIPDGGLDGQVAGVALGCRGQVGDGVRQDDPRLRHAHVFRGLHGGDGERQAARIGIADILAGEDHHPPRDEARILAGLQHLGQPVERRMGIGTAQALDEGRDRVVVAVFVAVVGDHPALHAVLHRGGIHMHDAFGVRRRAAHGHLERRQGAPGVTLADVGQEPEGRCGDLRPNRAEAARGVAQRAVEQLAHGRAVERAELEDERA